MLLVCSSLQAHRRYQLAVLREWRDDALCRGVEPGVFFPADARLPDAYDRARTMCEQCPVRYRCLTLALSWEAIDDKWGMFGGLTPRERSERRKIRARAIARL